jgi:hypothetical protein
MDSILSHHKRRDKEDIIDMRLIEQAYGSDYPDKVTPHPLGINIYLESTIFSKSMAPSVYLEEALRLHKDEHLSD